MRSAGRLAVAVLVGGTLYGLAFPPYDRSAAAWVALVPLILMVRGVGPRWAFAYGALYGYACAAAVSAWLVQALARFFGIAWPLAFVVGSLYAFLFWGLAFGVFAAGAAVLMRTGDTLSVQLGMSALWVASELLRGRVMRQPWGLIGYTQHAHPALIQIAALTGVYGVSFAVALANIAVTKFVLQLRTRRPYDAVNHLLLPAVLIISMWSVGALVDGRGPIGGFAGRTVAVVQTNVEPARDWTRSYTDRQIRAHMDATQKLAAASSPGLVVWPEYAVPRYLDAEPVLAAELSDLALHRNADLIFGTPRFGDGHAYNSVRLIRANGRDGGTYDKQQLVLLSESNPLSMIHRVVSEEPTQFTAGDGPGLLQGYIPFGVSICHEILFPELIARSVNAGAALLVNVSNDGWIDAGRGIAPRQHFAMAAFRAVETRRYLVRAAVTGMSGVIDPYGHVLAELPPGTKGVLTAGVAGRTAMTPYVQFGDTFAILCVLGAGAILFRRPFPRVERHSGLVPAARAS